MFGGASLERYRSSLGVSAISTRLGSADRTRSIAIAYMLLASMCFAAIEMVGARLVRGQSALETVWFRYATHLLVMLVVFAPRFRTGLVRTQRLGLQIARSLTMLAMPLCYLLAASHMPSVDVWSVYWTSPIVALALSTWVLGERAGRTRWMASVVGFVGVLVMLHPDPRTLTPAVVLAFGMGVCISLHLMFSRMLRTDHPITSLFYTGLWVFLVLSFGIRTFWVVPSLTSLVGMGLIGVIGLLGLYSLARAGELAPLAVVASFAYTEGLWEMGFGLVVLHVVPSLTSVTGALIVAATVAFLLVYEHRRAPVPALTASRR